MMKQKVKIEEIILERGKNIHIMLKNLSDPLFMSKTVLYQNLRNDVKHFIKNLSIRTGLKNGSSGQLFLKSICPFFKRVLFRNCTWLPD